MTSKYKPSVAVSGSIAYDHIMSFGGSFADHIIPEKTHVISVSFLVDTLRKQRGGVAGNIAYNLALLGESSYLVGAVGNDFAPYRQVFETLGIDLSGVLEVEDQLSASAFMMADQRDNLIASFYPGPSSLAVDIAVESFAALAAYAIVGPTDPEVMRRHAASFGATTTRLIFDPAFQIIILSAEDLIAGIDSCWGLVGNDYEFAMIERKTGLSIDALTERVPFLAVTFGDQGAELRAENRIVRVPAAKADVVKDPTGAGDAFRSGLIKGLLLEQPLEVTGRLACLAAVYAVERVGTQEHVYTPREFIARFDANYPDYAGVLQAEAFHHGVSALLTAD